MNKKFALLLVLIAFSTSVISNQKNNPRVISFDKGNLQDIIDKAPIYAVISCNPSIVLAVANTIVINKPLTIEGLNAKLNDGVGGKPLLKITSRYVNLAKLRLEGNLNTIPRKDRMPLIYVAAGDFVIRDCDFYNSSKDGIMVSASGLPGDIINGLIQNIKGYGNDRDLVSISGDDGNGGRKIRNVLIDHVLCFKSISRGAVEISDGTDFVTARNIYAEDALYGVDIQDHKSPNQQNTNVTVTGALIRRCRYGVVTRNSDFNHTRLTLSNIIIENCIEPIKISNTSHVIIEDIQVTDNKSNKPAVQFKNCKYVHADKFHISPSASLGVIMQVTNTDFFHFSNSFIDNSRSEAKQNILIEYNDEKHYKSLVMRDIIFTNKDDSLSVNTNFPDQLDDFIIENTNAKVFKK